MNCYRLGLKKSKLTKQYLLKQQGIRLKETQIPNKLAGREFTLDRFRNALSLYNSLLFHLFPATSDHLHVLGHKVVFGFFLKFM